MLYITNSTLLPEAICCCLQTSTYCCFYQGREIYMYINFRSQNFYTLLSYMDTCIAIIMYCQRLFLLFTCKQHCLHTFFSGDLPATNICLHAKFQVWWCYGFGRQLFNKIKRKKMKNLKKHVSLYFPHVISQYIYFW